MRRYNEYSTCQKLWNLQYPSHWNVLPLYALAKPKSICDCNELELLSVYLDSGVVRFSSRSEKRTNATSSDLSKYQRVDVGDFVLNNQQAWRGSVGVSKYIGIVSPAYIVLSMNDILDSTYANYLFRQIIMVDQYMINSKSVGSIQRNIYWTALKRISVLVPPHTEQEQIVNFLNWKISGINQLIEKRHKTIAELENLKETIIDGAVIKGLHEADRRHNDNIRWNIEYPCAWGLRRIREVFSFRKGLSITKANLEETGIPVISYGQVHSKKNSMVGLNDDILKYINPSYLTSNPSALVTRGDFIFADTSEDRTGCGNCAYIDRDGEIFAGYHSIIAHPIVCTNNKYFAYLFKSPTWRYQIRKKVNGVKVYSITQQMLKDAFVLVPSEEEQREIVKYLDGICQKIDALVAKTEEKIAQLHDLKAVIISEVVTGQIDVRDVVIPEYEYVVEESDEDTDEGSDIEETEEQEE